MEKFNKFAAEMEEDDLKSADEGNFQDNPQDFKSKNQYFGGKILYQRAELKISMRFFP